MRNAIKIASAAFLTATVTLAGQTPASPPNQRADQASSPRATLQWPPGYIEPNTPSMKYVTPETPQGTGRYPAIMATDPTAAEFVLYYPANLGALGRQKLPILLWGNG